MDETCSSGNANRIVNALSAIEGNVEISYESQVCANVIGRLAAKIRDIDDEVLREKVNLGGMEGAEEECRKIYRSFVDRVLEEIRSEMQKEFVGGKYITVAQFNEYFVKAKSQV